MRRHILGKVVIAVVLAGCAPTTTTTPSGATSTSSAVPTVAVDASDRPIPSPVVAQTAARAVLDASSDDARRQAVLAILHGVNIGVYTADGQAVAAGAERGPDDFYAYDFEVDGLAAAVRDGDRIALADIAADLARIGLIDAGVGDPAAVVASAIAAGTTGALTHPDEAASYPLLVARELMLGAPDPVDLAALSSNGETTFDTLTAFLVTADFVLPSIEATPVTAGASLRTASLATKPMAAELAAGPCSGIGAPQGQGGWHAGVGARRLPGGGSSANASSSAYLQLVLGNAIVETAWKGLPGGGLSWHYRHDAGDTDPRGYAIGFRIRITTPAGAILCGALAGVTLPPTGPILGVPVAWQYADLQAHGTTDCPALGCATSDTDGRSTLKHLPKVEPEPWGIGPESHAQAEIIALADVAAALAPALAARVQGASRQRFYWGGQISYHKAYDVSLELTSDLRVIEALNLIGHVADAHADGSLNVDSVRSSQYKRGACDSTFCIGQIMEIQSLNVRTTAATDGPKCTARGVTPHVTMAGPAGKVDWFVLDAVIYPKSEIRVRMDSGPDNERLDTITYVPCDGPNVVSKPGVSTWEHYMLASRAKTGLAFVGQKVGTADGPGWDYVGTDVTWRDGGIIAIWDAPENCGGSCDASESRLTMTIRVVPKP